MPSNVASHFSGHTVFTTKHKNKGKFSGVVNTYENNNRNMSEQTKLCFNVNLI